MPDLRDDTAEDGFHEIQFSSKELIFLFMAASVVLIFVFLAGVLVGRDTTARAGEPPISAGEPPAVDPVAPAAVEMKPTAAQEQTPPPTPAPLSYPETLSGKKSEAVTPKPVDTPQPPQVAEAKPEVPPAAPAQTSKPEPAPRAAEAGPDVPTSGRPGQWVIQVAALKTRRAAAESVQSLRTKGYDAFLEDTAKGLYRVRIGKFRTRDDAERIARRLEKEGTKSVVQR